MLNEKVTNEPYECAQSRLCKRFISKRLNLCFSSLTTALSLLRIVECFRMVNAAKKNGTLPGIIELNCRKTTADCTKHTV